MSTIEKLYRRNNKEGSPAELDHLILAAAKQSCETVAVRKKSRLLYALPTAAVLVFGLSMIINFQNENQAIKTIPSFDTGLAEKQITVKKEVPKRKSQHRLAKMAQEIEQPLPVVAAPQIEEEQKFQKTSTRENSSVIREEVQSLGALATSSISTEKANDTNNFQPKDKPKQDFSDNISADGFTNSVTEPERENRLDINKDRKPRKKSNNIQVDINKLEQLIKQQNFKQAEELLIVLKQRYPDYDFTTYLLDG